MLMYRRNLPPIASAVWRWADAIIGYVFAPRTSDARMADQRSIPSQDSGNDRYPLILDTPSLKAGAQCWRDLQTSIRDYLLKGPFVPVG